MDNLKQISLLDIIVYPFQFHFLLFKNFNIELTLKPPIYRNSDIQGHGRIFDANYTVSCLYHLVCVYYITTWLAVQLVVDVTCVLKCSYFLKVFCTRYIWDFQKIQHLAPPLTWSHHARSTDARNKKSRSPCWHDCHKYKLDRLAIQSRIAWISFPRLSICLAGHAINGMIQKKRVSFLVDKRPKNKRQIYHSCLSLCLRWGLRGMEVRGRIWTEKCVRARVENIRISLLLCCSTNIRVNCGSGTRRGNERNYVLTRGIVCIIGDGHGGCCSVHINKYSILKGNFCS